MIKITIIGLFWTGSITVSTVLLTRSSNLMYWVITSWIVTIIVTIVAYWDNIKNYIINNLSYKKYSTYIEKGFEFLNVKTQMYGDNAQKMQNVENERNYKNYILSIPKLIKKEIIFIDNAVQERYYGKTYKELQNELLLEYMNKYD